MKGWIYKVVNLSNWKVYIGQTTQDVSNRWKAHIKDSARGSSYPFHRALRKYGVEMFSFDVIAELDRTDEKELHSVLDDLEKYYIQYYDSMNWGYNAVEGGGGHSTRRYLYLEVDEEGNLVEVWKGTENVNALQYGSALRAGRIVHKSDSHQKYVQVYGDWQKQIIEDTLWNN